MPTMKQMTLSFCVLTLCAAGCGGAGMGKGVRSDVITQMATIKEPVSKCYKEAMDRIQKAKGGTLVLSFKIEPKTGKFLKPKVAKSSVRDPALTDCVVKEVSSLVLAKPQSTTVGIDHYPIRFTPVD